MGAPITLYVDSLFLSPYAMSVYVALTEKQLPFEVRPIDLSAGEQRMQPFQCRALTSRVPALTHADFNLTESSVIAEYLEEAFPPPEHTALFPSALQERARARQLQAWLRSDLGALRQERPTETVFYGEAGPPLSDDAHAAAAKLIRVASYLVGVGQTTLFDKWCIADTDLAVMLKRLSNDDLPDTLRAYADAQWQRPAVQKWLEHNAAAR
ncbi:MULTISPECIES: glutathione transferase [Achromobacter]|uniref:glutathione transferase n=1 Tax=Achromobacter TaxID=222 RepID=UPI001EF2AE2C|nr:MULTISPECIES: glutathione transferase [Achromobacter]MCG7324894.1 glutathione transferase [Achromobacter sp. ACRQX]MDH0685615.1 glutathione transferase [Achromobacter animicus]